LTLNLIYTEKYLLKHNKYFIHELKNLVNLTKFI
jgi:hypothetical protein